MNEPKRKNLTNAERQQRIRKRRAARLTALIEREGSRNGYVAVRGEGEGEQFRVSVVAAPDDHADCRQGYTWTYVEASRYLTEE